MKEKLGKKAKSLLGRLEAFLPKMKESNLKLEQQIKEGQNLDIEIINDDDKQHIEMNLDLGVFEVATKALDIKIPGRSDKSLIEDLSSSKERVLGHDSSKRDLIDETSSPYSQIPVVYSKPAKHHKKVESSDHSTVRGTEISQVDNLNIFSKQENSDIALIEEL